MNKLDKYQQLLVITMEECAELQMVCSKILREGSLDSTSYKNGKRKQLIEELGDVYCMIQLMHNHGLVESEELNSRVVEKRKKLEVWSDLIQKVHPMP